MTLACYESSVRNIIIWLIQVGLVVSFDLILPTEVLDVAKSCIIPS